MSNSYFDEVGYLVENDSRNKFIVNLTCSLKGNTLVLFNYVDSHGKQLYKQIKSKIDKDRKVFLVHGKIDADDREYIRSVVEKEKNAVICASYGTFSTGVNIKNLNNIILAHPSKSKIRVLQSIGRGLRKHKDKSHLTVYDIADDTSKIMEKNYVKKHYIDRLKIYKKEEFNFKIYKVRLKDG